MTREEAIEVIEQDIPCEHDTDLIEALEMAIKALEPCEDAISRQACLYVLTGGDVEKQFPKINETLKEIINSIPPLKPAEPQTGHWKRIGYDIYECSICGQNVMTGDICAYRHCHGCGAHMKGGD